MRQPKLTLSPTSFRGSVGKRCSRKNPNCPSERRLLIGYMVPEFPGQTHIMFWREILALREHGIDVALVSTRRPNSAIVSHSWANQAVAQHDLSCIQCICARCTEHFPRTDAGPDRNDLPGSCRCASSSGEMTAIQRVKLLPLIFFRWATGSYVTASGTGLISMWRAAALLRFIAALAAEIGGISVSLSLLGPRLDTYGPGQSLKWSQGGFRHLSV
jgi:colanic acid/amylovoran biosynthesis glycosyltransferase